MAQICPYLASPAKKSLKKKRKHNTVASHQPRKLPTKVIPTTALTGIRHSHDDNNPPNTTSTPPTARISDSNPTTADRDGRCGTLPIFRESDDVGTILLYPKVRLSHQQNESLLRQDRYENCCYL